MTGSVERGSACPPKQSPAKDGRPAAGTIAAGCREGSNPRSCSAACCGSQSRAPPELPRRHWCIKAGCNLADAGRVFQNAIVRS
jgi:hypothetical protein